MPLIQLKAGGIGHWRPTDQLPEEARKERASAGETRLEKVHIHRPRRKRVILMAEHIRLADVKAGASRGRPSPAGPQADEREQRPDGLARLIASGAGNRAVGAYLNREARGARTARDASSSDGHVLDPSLRAEMESHLGADLSGVRLHTSPAATASANALRARAYAVGQDIVFGPGEYRPEHTAGRALIAHELTHTVQQALGGAAPAGSDSHERVAGDSSSRWADGLGPAPVSQGSAIGIARAPQTAVVASTPATQTVSGGVGGFDNPLTSRERAQIRRQIAQGKKLNSSMKNRLRSDARYQWRTATMGKGLQPGAGYQVHHITPLEFAHRFPTRFPNDPSNLVLMENVAHNRWHKMINDQVRSKGGNLSLKDLRDVQKNTVPFNEGDVFVIGEKGKVVPAGASSPAPASKAGKAAASKPKGGGTSKPVTPKSPAASKAAKVAKAAKAAPSLKPQKATGPQTPAPAPAGKAGTGTAEATPLKEAGAGGAAAPKAGAAGEAAPSKAGPVGEAAAPKAGAAGEAAPSKAGPVGEAAAPKAGGVGEAAAPKAVGKTSVTPGAVPKVGRGKGPSFVEGLAGHLGVAFDLIQAVPEVLEEIAREKPEWFPEGAHVQFHQVDENKLFNPSTFDQGYRSTGYSVDKVHGEMIYHDSTGARVTREEALKPPARIPYDPNRWDPATGA
ncbi:MULTISPECIES: DUF4157 domain-containing protein [unclassified Streptomyces]|uniref:eCIS core domain-containing protein n=1 Tax=unclassified Streptomyces TaxID=2593676 RepID=UPI0032506FC9